MLGFNEYQTAQIKKYISLFNKYSKTDAYHDDKEERKEIEDFLQSLPDKIFFQSMSTN
ncbi:hypothetical protein [Methanococcoides sp. FTZ1]|uniref:hypothetical protein n=1 Tax=Methanococcoides sp. FTZ1 TaxID=3439061 RepID=UPI003F8504B3